MSDRVAIITDVHANLPALEAALARIEELRIDRVYCICDRPALCVHTNSTCFMAASSRRPERSRDEA